VSRIEPPLSIVPRRTDLDGPGLDRSLLRPAVPKAIAQDNPFPTFGAKKAPQPVPKDGLNQAMSRMDVNDARPGRDRNLASPPRGQPMPPQNRGPPQSNPPPNGRQDSGHFEGQGHNQRPSQNRGPPSQRQQPLAMENARARRTHMRPRSELVARPCRGQRLCRRIWTMGARVKATATRSDGLSPALLLDTMTCPRRRTCLPDHLPLEG
jgi:hypothetical protein